jgi:ribosomal protein S27AE
LCETTDTERALGEDEEGMNTISPEQVKALITSLVRGESLRTAAKRAGGCHIMTALRYKRLLHSNGARRKLKCPQCKSSAFNNHGSFNGVQRHRCKRCGKTFSLHEIERVVLPIINAMEISVTPDKVRVTKKRYSRGERGEYLKHYFASKDRNTHARLKWRDELRGHLEEILAESPRPLLLEEIVARASKTFMGLNNSAVGYMLHRNRNGTFVPVGQGWTYKPDELPPSLYPNPEMWREWRARRLYFDRHGAEDKFVTDSIRRMIAYQEQRLIDHRVGAALKAQATTDLFLTGITLANTLKESKP